MEDWIRVLKAADAAAKWHADQRRKGHAREPYINHLLEVASLVTQATKGEDPNLVIAALLHDAVEDQEVPYDIVQNNFGEDVANLVREVTDDKTLAKEDRKAAQVRNAPKKSPRAKVLKLADKTSNLRAITQSPANGWSVARRLHYVAWAREVAAGLRGVNPWLEGRFDEAAEAAERSIAPSL
jgi:GTP diphosphokinase / guanosine-3',5'-bis(diphosphate) 3'-diphosphatase